MIEKAVTWAFRSGMRKGVVGGSGLWLVIAVAAGAIRLLSRPDRRAGKSTTLTVRPGESYVIVGGQESGRR